jgi:hypothetical protein
VLRHSGSDVQAASDAMTTAKYGADSLDAIAEA